MKIFACKTFPAQFNTWIMMDVLEWLIGLHGNPWQQCASLQEQAGVSCYLHTVSMHLMHSAHCDVTK